MDMPSPYLRHTLIWSLPGGEVAHCRIHWLAEPALSVIPGGFLTGRIAEGLTFWNAIKEYYAPEIVFLGSRVQAVYADHTIAQTAEDLTAASAGTSTSSMLPHQVSVVCTTMTDDAGRSGRGRFYLPPPAKFFTTNVDRLSGAACEDISAAAAALLEKVETVEFDANSVVASTAQGEFKVITSCKVGDVLDTQRRRRNELVEAYAVTAVNN